MMSFIGFLGHLGGLIQASSSRLLYQSGGLEA